MSQAQGNDQTNEDVKEYYGKRVQSRQDIELQGCLHVPTKVPQYVRDTLTEVADEVSARWVST